MRTESADDGRRVGAASARAARRDIDQITGVSALSTVPSVLREMRVMLTRYWGHVPHVLVEPGVRTGVPLLVDNPKEVGRRPDRQQSCGASPLRRAVHRGRLRDVHVRRRRVRQG